MEATLKLAEPVTIVGSLVRLVFWFARNLGRVFYQLFCDEPHLWDFVTMTLVLRFVFDDCVPENSFCLSLLLLA